LNNVYPLFRRAGRLRLWIAVEIGRPRGFSAVLTDFPQVFHSRLWKEKCNKNNRLGGFSSYSQALLELLVLIRSFEKYLKL
jgi:hypothetical protein